MTTTTAMAAPAPQRPDPFRSRALAIIRTGRLTILESRYAKDGTEGAASALARVRSSRPGHGYYAIDFDIEGRPGNVWVCTCPKRGNGCAHVRAAQLVLGYADVQS